MIATTDLAKPTENAVQAPLPVQVQENYQQNQQRGRGGFRGKGRGRGRGVQNGGCFTCGQMSHWHNECPQNQFQQPQTPYYVQPQTEQYYPQVQQQQPVYTPVQLQPQAPMYMPTQYQQRGGPSGGGGFQGQPRGGGVPNMNQMPLTAWSGPYQ